MSRPQLTKALVTKALGSAAVLLYSALHLYHSVSRYGLSNRRSDFLGVFPVPRIANWFGKYEEFYVGRVVTEFHEGLSWGYGPILHLFTLPLFGFSTLESAYTFLEYVLLLGYLLTAAVFTRIAPPTAEHNWIRPLVVLIVLNFSPAYEALFQRNPELIELVLIGAAMWASLHHREVLTGILISLATGIKFLPGILIIYLFISGRRRAAWTAIISTAIIVIVTQAVLGWQNNATLTYLVTGNDPYLDTIYHESPTSQSISGLVIRIMNDLGIESGHILISRIVIIVFALAIMQWVWRRRRDGNWMVHWSILLIGAIFLLPHNQPYYLCLLIPAYVVALRQLCLGAPRRHWLLFWLSYLAVGWPIPLSVIQKVIFRDIWLIQSLYEWSVPIYGSLGLVIVLIVSSNQNDLNTSDQSRS